jgi:hypothetical protein
MSDLVRLLSPKYPPVAIFHTDTFPSYAQEPEREHCCIKSMFIPCVTEGRAVAADGSMVRCAGALNGLGLGGENPEGRTKLAEYYSDGPSGDDGRRFFCDRDHARSNYLEQVEVYGSRDDIAVMRPLEDAMAAGDPIETVVFYVDPLELSALMTLAQFSGEPRDSCARCGFALACEHLYAVPRQEGESDSPRLVLGMTEFYPRRFCDPDRLTVSMPYSLFERLEKDAPYSFLADGRWRGPARQDDA